jgi:hypothetical protein
MLTPEKFQKVGALTPGVQGFQFQANMGIKVLTPAGVPGQIIHGNA